MTRTAVVIAILIAIVAPTVAEAQQDDSVMPPDLSLTVGGRFWIPTGDTTISFAAPSGSPNILSELRWRDLTSIAFEGNAELVWKRLVLLGTLGGGGVLDGTLIDDDYALDNRQGLTSSTRSDAEGGLVYFTGDVGLRIADWGQRRTANLGYLDIFTGFQFWFETYDAYGASGTLSRPSDVRVISQEYTFYSLRIGARTHIPITQRLGVSLQGVVLPWSYVELEDEHPLRPELRQDPSFSAEADGGFGYQIEGHLIYNVWKGLSIEVGYRYWYLDTDEGDMTAHRRTGDVTSKLNEIVIERHGPYVGVTYRF